jgi:hypothetical protein
MPKRVLVYDYASNRSSRQTRGEVDEKIRKESSTKLYPKKIRPGHCKVRVRGRDLLSPSDNEKPAIPLNTVVASVQIPWDVWMMRFFGQYDEICVVCPLTLIEPDRHS